AGDGRGVAMAHPDFRRTPIGALDPFHRDGGNERIRDRPSRAGDPCRAGERGTIDDHRLVARTRGAAMSPLITRRRSVVGAVTGAGALLTGCDRAIEVPAVRKMLFAGEDLHRGLQRALTDRRALAREFSVAEMSPVFRSNGTRDPGTP